MKKQKETHPKKTWKHSVKYDNKDEMRAIAFLLGMAIGSLLGEPTSIGLGLFSRFGEGLPPGDSIGWLVERFSFFSFQYSLGV